ncbi:MAG: hypothetical protein FH748_03910 [Balneolaceae bacterium]|nr:hypothetical protein [Balneolaceae bacterium]
MKVQQFVWNKERWLCKKSDETMTDPDIGFVFGNHTDHTDYTDSGAFEKISEMFPNMVTAGCTTAGEIIDTEIHDGTIVFTAIELEHSRVETASIIFNDTSEVYRAGKEVTLKLPKKDLSHVMVLSEGLDINGSEVVRGISEVLPDNVKVTGGLAGDAGEFQSTSVMLDGKWQADKIVVVGFYGDAIKVGFGCYGGWDTFGPDRLITRSSKNELFELDNKPALELYKTYLGDYAKQLPSSGLLFPLCIATDEEGPGIVRTILGVNEKNQSLIFAGDIPEGKYGRLMKANHHRLIEGAYEAAMESVNNGASGSPDLAFLFSCIGRRQVLKQRVEEELEAVREVYGRDTVLSGFYSFGEIAPILGGSRALLHNQTMCITTLSEK